jgi:hypothetical protein
VDISPAPRRPFLALALWTLLLPACASAALAVGRLAAERWSEDPEHVPYRGWQVDLAEAALGVALVASCCLAAILLGRRWRGLRQRSPYRLAPLLLGLAAGLLLATGSAAAVAPPLRWVSNHTSAAAAARAEEQAWLAAYPKAPPPPAHSSHLPAPRVVAVHLLRTADLGRGWYDMQRPTTHSLSYTGGTAAPAGQTMTAATTLQHVTWTGQMWLADVTLTESIRRFATVAQAEAYLTRQWPVELCRCPSYPEPWSVRTVDDIRYWQQVTTTSRGDEARRQAAGFRVGNDVVEVRVRGQRLEGALVTGTAAPPAALPRFAQLARKRALAT